MTDPADSTQPLTPEEEADLRTTLATGSGSPSNYAVMCLLATLDAERARTADPGGLREAALSVKADHDANGHSEPCAICAALASETTAPAPTWGSDTYLRGYTDGQGDARTADPGGLREAAQQALDAFDTHGGFSREEWPEFAALRAALASETTPEDEAYEAAGGGLLGSAFLASETTAPETTTVMPCPNCGDELYDSITTKWDGKVPRCPRCAADMRNPIPTIEEQMEASGFLRRASETTAPAPTWGSDTYLRGYTDGQGDARTADPGGLREALLEGPHVAFPNLPHHPTLVDVLDAVAKWMDDVDDRDGNPRHEVQEYLRERATALRAALASETTAPAPHQPGTSYTARVMAELGEPAPSIPDDAPRAHCDGCPEWIGAIRCPGLTTAPEPTLDADWGAMLEDIIGLWGTGQPDKDDVLDVLAEYSRLRTGSGSSREDGS